MACPIGPEEIKKLKMFIGFCSQKPEIINMPQLSFFKEFIEQLGGKVPEGMPTGFPTEAEAPKPEPTQTKPTPAPESPPVQEEESEPESDVEIDREGCVEPDTDEPQEMGDAGKEPTDDDFEKASECRSQAAAAYSEQKYDEAIDLYTQAILLNPGNALFYAKRGQAFLKLVKPNACIRDCNRALQLNCDSAAAYKFRGRANRLLGNWEDAAMDLRQACKIDYDEEADEWLREVTPNAKKLEQHRIKQERRKAEKEVRARQERVRRAQEANRRAAEENKNRNDDMGGDGYPGGGAGGFSFNESDIFSAFKDPEVAAALQDIMANPANIVKYQNNPKILALLEKLGATQGAAGGMPGFMGGGFPGGFPGAGGAGSAPSGESTKPPPKTDLNDDGLD
ncbi:hsc70-interacting protein 1-like isoform X2 [Phlebotomus papatasi]|uniref:hsc70-interacting protein 1-like isoform X2 n=1 Tax=Phlebotomus papatasi TaxID=29031 RepID=UPI002483F601|nr:hsc70-interacting protein 1-like isoform X2 [Phlebotomus papatasi]